MAATNTRSDLVAQALANLGVLEAGQVPSNEDASAVDDHVDGMLAFLAAEGAAYIGDPDEIPAELLGPLADYLAEDAAPEFGRPTSNGAMEQAKMRMRLITRGRPTYTTLKTDYF